MLQNRVHSIQKIIGIKYELGIVFSLVLVFFVVVTCMPVNADSSSGINILIIFSWHKDLPWQKEIEKGFEHYYKEMSSRPNIFYEYLDAARFRSQDQVDIFKDYMSKKYARYQMDCVIYESEPAARLFISFPELFKDSKIYIVSPGSAEDEVHTDTSTVIPVNADYEGAAKKLLAVSKTKTIYLVAGASADSKKTAQLFSKYLSKFDPDKKVISLVGLPMKQLLNKVSNLEPNSIIFYLLVFQDGEGVRYIPYDAAKQISDRASVPVYSLWTSLLGSGIVGGYLLSGELVGKEVA